MHMQQKDQFLTATQSGLTMDDLGTDGAQAGNSSAVVIDVEKYQNLIDHPDLSEEQKQRVVLALWSIVVAFVDFGFRLEAKPPA